MNSPVKYSVQTYTVEHKQNDSKGFSHLSLSGTDICNAK